MSWLRIKLGVCFCLTVTSVLIQVTVGQRSTLRCSLLRSKAESPSQTNLLFSENQFKENDEIVLTGSWTKETLGPAPQLEGDRWLRGLHRISYRVFQLTNEEETWPTLKFGWRTVAAMILGGFGAALASAGGLGGGGLFVPLFNLLLQFNAKTSTALSNFMILGGSLANLYINLRQRHPHRQHKPLIDFDVVLLLQPNMLLGISTGVILNVALPDWAITAALTLTLTCLTVQSFKSGLKRWEKETRQNCLRESAAGCVPQKFTTTVTPDSPRQSTVDANPEGRSSEGGDPPPLQAVDDHPSVDTCWKGEENPKSSTSNSLLQHAENARAQEALSEPLLHEESFNRSSESFPFDKLRALAVTWFAFFTVQVLRGGKGSQGFLGIPSCGFGYWLITVTQIPLALGVTSWTINRLHAAHPSKQDPEAIEEEGFVLRPESCRMFAWLALVAGISGGLLGIGGGMIINPMLLAIGMMPQVTAGTCASMVFFSSSMSVVQFWLMGRVPVGYALSAALLSSVSSFLGITLVHHAIAKYNRASLIVFSVAIVMGVSAGLMAGFGGLGVWQQYESEAYMGFHYPC